MNKLLLCMAFLLLCVKAKTQTLTASYYLDFGLDGSANNGRLTTSPDANNNHWNNITENGVNAAAVVLKNSTGVSSTINLTITTAFLKNGIAQGGLTAPSASLLGDFAIPTATEDFFYVENTGKGVLRLSGLNTAKVYVFKIFGTRNSTDVRISQYKITGNNTSIKTLQTSGTGIGANNYNGNNNNIAVSDNIVPTSNGTIDIELNKTAGNFGYIGIIKIEEYTPAPTAPTETDENWTKLYIDLGPNDVTNGNATINPDANGNKWNNLTNGTAGSGTLQLTDFSGKNTGVLVDVTKSFFTNGINHGGLLSSSSALLGEFAVNTATQDYFFVDNNSGILKFSGLRKDKKYIFHFFGSRATTETRIAEYSLSGANTNVKTLLTSGTGIGNGGYNGNNSTIVSSDTVFADINGSIALEVKRNTGSYGHLNIVKIEAFDNPGTKYAIDNQGFELGDFRYWTINSTALPAAIEVNSVTVHSGTYAAKLTGSAATLHQQIRFPGSNAYYKASGYFYASNTLQSGQAASLTLSYFDENNQLLSNSQSEAFNSTSTLNNWKKLSTILEVPAGTKYIKATVNWTNPNNLPGVIYFDDLLLEPYVPVNPLKIVYFGSSVPYGQGATNKKGYTSMYTDVLTNRTANGGTQWQTANISVPGDNTVKVLNRYDSDLIPQKAKYVVFALALGNEGIHENGLSAFNQFETNIKNLITKAREDGLIPVITNSYTRNDYNATDYDFVKKMNLLIHQWEIPSVNLLGAVDDLTGKWTDGYWDDTLHPNDAGHTELAYTMVPSLFDALDAQKPIPQKVIGSAVTFVKTPQHIKNISFAPEGGIHPFTVAFSFKANGTGTIAQLTDASNAIGTISINNGVLNYNSAKGGNIIGNTNINDGQWYKVILTHYYAKGVTFLYCDSVAQGQLQEKLTTNNIKIGGADIPSKVEYKNLLFYRSAMNEEEIKYIARDILLKSSLEIYAPLDGKNVSLADSLANLAQSTNFLSANTTNLTTLPLSFLSFNVSLTGLQKKQAILKWTTEQEVNVNVFMLERSDNGKNFTVIGEVPAKNTAGTNNYTFTDNNPLPGTAYYRIKETDKNGTFNYSKIITMKNIDGVFLFPNPASNYLELDVPIYLRGGKINIFDASGKMIYTKVADISQRINLSHFSNGTYFVKIASGNNVQTLKFAKQ
ncbi:T9SS type A sorting domain-containing protein [Pedobacter sp.]